MKLIKLLVAAFILTGLSALAYQTATRAQRPAPKAMAAMLPQGALLTIESPDFAALLRSWNRSPQQKTWLSSDNYSVFSNSRLFGRLTDAREEFIAAARLNNKDDSDLFGADFLTQVAGRQSIFAWYDVGNLEFLYLTRMPAAQASKIALLRAHPGFAQRQSGGHTFFVRKSTGTDSTPRTVAFAQVPSADGGTLLVLATREDLIAGALTLVATPGNSVATEPWYTDAQASLPAEPKPPALHMVLNLDRLVPLPSFHTYWVQQNISQMKQYRAAVSDLYLEGTSFREERAILLKSAAPDPGNPALSGLAALAPQTSGQPSGVFRATATHDPALAITALEEKLLGRITLGKLADTQALDPELTAQQAGASDDLETRIDAPAPVPATFSNQSLTDACKAAGLAAVLTWSAAQPLATPTGLWVPIHSAVILQSANPWNPQTLQSALQQSLRGTLTTANLGIDFRTENGIYTLTGPKPLYFAVRNNLAFFSDDQPTLTALLAQPAPASGATPATQIAGFEHTTQRAPYARLTSLIDGTNQPATADTPATEETPAYFSRNLKSLSDSFATLTSERFTERPAETPAGPTLRQTVTYQWRPQ